MTEAAQSDSSLKKEEIYCKDAKYTYRIYNINADCKIGSGSGRGPEIISH
jgi:hypothetical protein